MARSQKKAKSLKEKKDYIFLKTLNRARNLQGCSDKRAAQKQPK